MTALHARGERSRPLAARKHARPRTLTLTLLVGTFILAGCATSSDWPFARSTPAPDASEYGLKGYEESTVPTRQYVFEEARHHNLPEQYLSEARLGLADIEAIIAATRASELQEEATLREGLAKIAAQRKNAEVREHTALAHAEKVQDQYSAKQNELWVAIAARERAIGSEFDQNAAMVESLRKEREMAHDEMISRAWQNYTQAQAKVETMRSVRRTTLEEGEAGLSEMRESFQATRARADATVNQLRTEAQSVRQQARARAKELEQRISSVRSRSQADAARLRSDADSLEKNSLARFNDMIARADSLTEHGSKEQFHLKVKTAETELRQAQAEYDRLRNEAQTTMERAEAEIERLQAEAERIAFLGDAGFTSGMAELQSWETIQRAEIAKQRVRAERLEKDARAEFVIAEAEARAKAARETAAHQSELADAKMKQIIAEAEHEAQRVRAQILNELAQRQQRGSVEFRDKTGPAPEMPADLHEVPESPQVTPVTPRVEPEHIAQFRAGLAKVMNLRANAEAKEVALAGTAEETRSRIHAVRSQYRGLSAEKLAIAEAMTKQASAQYADLNSQANGWLAMAEADYERALAEADAFRKEALAEASDLRAGAKAQRELALAQAELLRNESHVAAAHGESEARALEATFDATRRRGEAEYSRLWVEAESVEKANQALAMQINAQIAAAEQILQAELVKQDRIIDSAVAIAEANYSEATVNADAFARKAEVEIERMMARNDLERAMAAAEIEHLRNLSFSTVLKADATVGRITAVARAEREQSEAFADVASAMVQAEHDISRAELLAQNRSAEAREHAVRSRFDARVVQVQSERIRDLADMYKDDFYRRTNLEASLAQAEAARSEMHERFAQLKIEQQHLQRAARENWDERLAKMQQRPRTPLPQPDLGLPQDLELLTNVPVELD